MRARPNAFRISICLAATLLAACGGGGGGGGGSLPPLASAPGNGSVGAPSGGAPAAVAFSIAIPSAAPSGSARRVRYVSAGTKSVAVSYAGGSQSANCTTSCSLVLNVMPGTVTFTVNLYDAANGAGHLLSTGQTTATIVAGQSNPVNVVFGAVVASVSVTLGASTVTAGTAATIPVTVTAKDAAGYTIVGSDPFATPIALSDDDASGATRLSVTALNAPGAGVTLAYNGSASISAAHVAASVPGAGITAAPATLSVQGAPPTGPAPSAGVPSHIQTWYYYGLDDVNSSIPASWMAAHADYVEDDGFNALHAQAFKSAGGKFAAAYTDPSFVTYCSAPFTAPAGRCDGPIGNLVSSDESAWVHGPDGARVHRYVDAHFLYQDALNPGAPSAQSAFRQTTAAVAAAAPQLDYIFGDEAGSSFSNGDGNSASGWLYGFNAPSSEITTDAQYQSGESAMIAASVKPVFLNGATPYTKQPSYNGLFLNLPNTAGQNFETCYGESDGMLRDDAAGGPRWTLQSNALLAAFSHGKPAVCMDESSATAAGRIYFLASWWLTYNESYSVAAPQGALADGFTPRPEFDIVPRQPRTTATSDVAALRSNGAYVREFAACYQAGAAIGPCAAVVNPGTSTVALPPLSGRYTSALAVDNNSSYGGGKATWSGAVPTQLAPVSAVVLR